MAGSPTSSASVAKMLSMQGVQSVAVNSLPSPVLTLPEHCNQLLQGLGQGKSVGEVVHTVGQGAVGGLVVYGLLIHRPASK